VRQRREGGEVVYSLLVDDVRQLLTAGRVLLRQLAGPRDELLRELDESRDA